MKTKSTNLDIYKKNFPKSKKVYIEGSNKIKVPVRMIELTNTNLNKSNTYNEPVYVYDTTGPYTDEKHNIDLIHGLNPIRKEWIKNRKRKSNLITQLEYAKEGIVT